MIRMHLTLAAVIGTVYFLGQPFPLGSPSRA